MTSYTLRLPYDEFRSYIVETDEGGSWGDDYFAETFDKYKFKDEDDSDMIEIEYKYGKYSNGKTQIIWRIPAQGKARSLRYTSSSRFAFWWCGHTDELEDLADDTE